MTLWSAHAAQRAAERGLRLPRGLSLDPTRSYAVRLRHVGLDGAQLYGNASNGEYEWAIVRAGCVVTIMRRRGDQPSTPERLGVDTVIL